MDWSGVLYIGHVRTIFKVKLTVCREVRARGASPLAPVDDFEGNVSVVPHFNYISSLG